MSSRLTGGLVLMAWKDPEFRQVFRRSHLSAASFTLTGLLLLPLGSSFFNLLDRARKDSTRDMLQETIESFLTRETLTFGDRESVDVERVDIAWNQNPPVIRVIVRVSDPDLPSFKQVSAVQKAINRRQNRRFRLVVQRTAVDVVGPEVAPNPETPATEPELAPAPEPEQSIAPIEPNANSAGNNLEIEALLPGTANPQQTIPSEEGAFRSN